MMGTGELGLGWPGQQWQQAHSCLSAGTVTEEGGLGTQNGYGRSGAGLAQTPVAAKATHKGNGEGKEAARKRKKFLPLFVI